MFNSNQKPTFGTRFPVAFWSLVNIIDGHFLVHTPPRNHQVQSKLKESSKLRVKLHLWIFAIIPIHSTAETMKMKP